MRAMILAAALAALPVEAWSKNCTSGCACGDSCIDCSDTCHKDAVPGLDGDAMVWAVGLGMVALVLWLTLRDGPNASRSLDVPAVDVQAGESGGAILLRGSW